MGREFPIQKFCENEFKKDLNYTKARFDLVEKKVACHFSKTVTITITCDKKHKDYCVDPAKKCAKLRGSFAFNHQLVRSFVMEMFPPILKCFYSTKEKIKI